MGAGRLQRSLFSADTLQWSLFSADPLRLGSLLVAGGDKSVGCPSTPPPVLRLTRPSPATLTARCTLSNSTQGKLPTSRNPLTGLAQIARVRFPRPPHSIPESVLPRIPIHNVWSPATGRCLLAVPFLEACELPRSWRGSALGSETTCWRGSGSVVVRRLLRLWWANNCPLVSLVPGSSHAEPRAHSPWGWDSRAMAQSSRRRPARVRTRAVTRYTIGGSQCKRASGPCRGLTSVGRAPSVSILQCSVFHHISPYRI